MGTRNLDPGSKTYGRGNVYLDFSFNTNAAANPVTASYRGVGPDVVTGIVYAATGKYTLSFATGKDAYRYIISKFADLEDVAAPDGAYATIGNVVNEGSSTLPLSLQVATFTAGGALQQVAVTRRVSIGICFKNSTVGV